MRSPFLLRKSLTVMVSNAATGAVAGAVARAVAGAAFGLAWALAAGECCRAVRSATQAPALQRTSAAASRHHCARDRPTIIATRHDITSRCATISHRDGYRLDLR